MKVKTYIVNQQASNPDGWQFMRRDCVAQPVIEAQPGRAHDLLAEGRGGSPQDGYLLIGLEMSESTCGNGIRKQTGGRQDDGMMDACPKTKVQVLG
jgi:hypothetical protein